MSEKTSTPQAGPIWVVGGIVLLLVLIALAIGFWNNSHPSSSSTATVGEASSAVGGVLMPTDMPLETSTTAAFGMQMALQPGQSATVGGTPGRGLALRADASIDSLLMLVLEENTPLTIIEPSGDYPRYPVSSDGMNWYRVRRQEDGLVGWVNADFLVAEQ